MTLQLYNGEFVAPYTGKCKKYRRRTIRKRSEKGVYIIKENGIIVYVGMSQSCVTEALYRHFYRYNDTHRKPRTYYNIDNGNTYSVCILYSTADDAPKLERGLILGINPRDNRERFQSYLDALSVANIENALPVETEEIIDLPF